MTYVSNAERFGIEKGRLQGRIEGKLEGKLEAAQEMLAEGFDPSFIARITKLPLDRIKALQKKKEGYSNTSKDREDQLS